MPKTPNVHRSNLAVRVVKTLSGITAVVLIPFAQPRAVGGLVRKRNGPEITIRVNDLDKQIIAEGARLTGLRTADYVRQCAVHMAEAIKKQKGPTNAPPPDGSS